MQRLEVSGAVRPIYVSLGVKRLNSTYSIEHDTGLMFIGPCIIVIVEEWKTNLMSLAILFHFLCAQSRCASACKTNTTQTQPHQISNIQRTENKTTDVVIQQHSRKLLMMDILMSETCWAPKKWNKIASDIMLVFHSSTITMMHGPINSRVLVLSKIPESLSFEEGVTRRNYILK